MGLRHRVLPTSFQCCGLWVAFVIPVVSLPLIIGIPDSFSQCGTLLRKPPAALHVSPLCVLACHGDFAESSGSNTFKKAVTEYIVSTSAVIDMVRISYQPGVRCCALHTSWSYFTLDLGVQRTHRQSASRLTQPVNGNNFLLVDTSIRALQGVRFPPV